MDRRSYRIGASALALATAILLDVDPVPAQSVAQYRYDARGRLVALEDGVAARSAYILDSASNRTRVIATPQFPNAWPATSPAIGHIVGRAEADGWSARVEDPEGHVIFGPYTIIPTGGPHVAAYRMLVDNNSDNNSPVVILDVWDATTGTQIAVRQLTRMEWKAAGAYQVFELPFNIEPARINHAYEFRVYYQRSSYVRVERVGYR